MKRKTRLKVAVIKSIFVAIEEYKSLSGGDYYFNYFFEEKGDRMFDSGFSINIFYDYHHNYYAKSSFIASSNDIIWYEAEDKWNRKSVLKIFNLDYDEIDNICSEFQDGWMYDAEELDSAEDVINSLSKEEIIKFMKLIKDDYEFDSLIKKLLLTKDKTPITRIVDSIDVCVESL